MKSTKILQDLVEDKKSELRALIREHYDNPQDLKIVARIKELTEQLQLNRESIGAFL